MIIYCVKFAAEVILCRLKKWVKVKSMSVFDSEGKAILQCLKDE